MAVIHDPSTKKEDDQLMYLPISLSIEDLERGTKSLISLLESRPVDYVHCHVFHGGYTNAVFKATTKQSSYVIRVYGADTNLFIDREEEIYHLLLFKRLGLGPQIVCAFQNGACTEYLNGRALTPEKTRDLNSAKKVARKLAALHVKGDILLSSMCVERVPLLKIKFLNSWLNLVPNELPSVEDTRRLEEIKAKYGPLPEAALSVLKLVEEVTSPVLLCHNDLCCGNILQSEEGDIWFVDMEYAGINYRGFDIAQYFCEFAGVAEPDYSFFPSKDFQLEWLRAYLEEETLLKGSSEVVQQKDVDRLYLEVKHFVPACHLVWGIWSLFQANLSKIDYDYLSYAGLRFDQYRKNLLLLQERDS
jgi:ethanolamine kinase